MSKLNTFLILEYPESFFCINQKQGIPTSWNEKYKFL